MKPNTQYVSKVKHVVDLIWESANVFACGDGLTIDVHPYAENIEVDLIKFSNDIFSEVLDIRPFVRSKKTHQIFACLMGRIEDDEIIVIRLFVN